ncbi:MAG: 4Fe-4S binding protein, partial [Candidatus Omnitrophica bacterium]|nr:4Fe-4S binding protein [Candidatus Omnitrophota bacterium]
MAKKLVIARRVSQTFFGLLFVYILWSTTYPLKGIFSAQIFFKTDPLLMLVTALSERVILAGIVWSLVMLGLTLVFGRFFCGWICPLGALMDLATVEKKNRALKDRTNRRLRRIKYWILGIITLAALSGLQLAWFLDPVVIAGRFVSLNLIPTVTFSIDSGFALLIKNFNLYGPVYDLYRSLKSSVLGVHVRYFAHASIVFAFMIAIIAAAVYYKRFWCRAVCPLGALYAIAARHSLLTREVVECINCGKCKQDCRMGAIRDDASYVKQECILCMDCV